MKKLLAILGTSALTLALGTSVPAYAQHGHDDDHHGGPQNHQDEHHSGPQGHDARNDHNRPAPHPEYHQPARPDDHRVPRPPEHQQAYRPDPRQPHYHPANEHVDYHHAVPHPPTRDVWARERAQNWGHDHRSWHDRGGYVGYRIPPERFHEHFGRGHYFRIYGAPMVVVDGRPRFQYSGFWFSIVDPWPETWAANWYQTDDVYVDYVNDGYYLCNRSHPGIHIAINVSL